MGASLSNDIQENGYCSQKRWRMAEISARVALEPGFSILVESPLMIPALQAHVMALIA